MKTAVINFIFESGISLAVFTLVYQVFLRRETYFRYNRIYLLLSLAISFLLPFLHFQITVAPTTNMIGEVEVTARATQNILQTVTVYGTTLTGAFTGMVESVGWLKLLYLSGFLCFILVFMTRLAQIIGLVIRNGKEVTGRLTIVRIDKDITPFSFFHYVFISKSQFSGDEYAAMLAHEAEHARQHHSLDVIMWELATIMQWFNPFAWLMKRSVRENHEFLADRGVLQPGFSPAAYKMLLLKGSLETQPFIANNFNYSMLKSRIQMMTKIQSTRTAALKLSMGILAAAALFVVFAFDGTQTKPQEKKTTGQAKEAPAKAEQKTTTGNEIFVVVEEMPTFPGGEAAVRKYIANSVKYPEKAIKDSIQGKVFVTFVVDKTGKVVDPKIARGAHPLLDAEALRVVGTMPDWTPGKQKGVNVAVSYTMPIMFALK